MSDYSLIQELKREGYLRIYIDPRNGSLLDLSGNGNNGAPAAGAWFTGSGINTSQGEITVSGSASIAGITGFNIIYLYDKISIQGINSNPAGNNYIIEWRDASAGFALTWRNDGRMIISSFEGGLVAFSVNPNSAFNALGCLGLDFNPGNAANFYVNGNFLQVSAGGAAFDSITPPLTVNLLFGGDGLQPMRSPTSAFMLISKVLTATEHAQIYGELMS